MLGFIKYLEDRYQDNGNGETFWSGEGNGASGILPICSATKRICLAHRSASVHIGNCFGTLGGAIQRGMTPEQSAKEELHEETGYSGNIHTIPAYVFKSGTFSYYNFIGIVAEEFGFRPEGGSSWETDYITWFDYPEIQKMITKQSNKLHPGLLQLFQHSKNIIEQYVDNGE